MKLEGKILDQFTILVCRLSPENLACDGEISRTQVNRRRRNINREWKALEKEFGSKVTDEEVWTADAKAGSEV